MSKSRSIVKNRYFPPEKFKTTTRGTSADVQRTFRDLDRAVASVYPEDKALLERFGQASRTVVLSKDKKSRAYQLRVEKFNDLKRQLEEKGYVITLAGATPVEGYSVVHPSLERNSHLLEELEARGWQLLGPDAPPQAGSSRDWLADAIQSAAVVEAPAPAAPAASEVPALLRASSSVPRDDANDMLPGEETYFQPGR